MRRVDRQPDLFADQVAESAVCSARLLQCCSLPLVAQRQHAITCNLDCNLCTHSARGCTAHLYGGGCCPANCFCHALVEAAAEPMHSRLEALRGLQLISTSNLLTVVSQIKFSCLCTATDHCTFAQASTDVPWYMDREVTLLATRSTNHADKMFHNASQYPGYKSGLRKGIRAIVIACS